MNLKDILAKVAKGEALTDDERKIVSSYDPDSTAAAARRKAEDEAKKLADELAQLQAKLAEADQGKMTAAQKAEAERKALEDRVAKLQAQFEAEQTRAKTLARERAVAETVQRSGIKFVEGLDHSLLTGALAGMLKDVPDDKLADEATVKPLLDSFKARNKAAILDTSGHGAGSDPTRRVEIGANGKPVDQMTDAERAADLKKRGIF